MRTHHAINCLLLGCTITFATSGCGVGYTHTLFITKTNIGFEASTTPPTLELDIARVEGTVGPQFENGKKLPVLASFKFNSNWAFSPHVGSTFATGDAATTLAALYDNTTPDADWISRVERVTGKRELPSASTLKLNNEPHIERSLLDWLSWLSLLFPKPDFQRQDVRPVFFGTDTTLGIKIAWSGMTGQYPDSAKLGYNRKELALVPITYEKTSSDSLSHHLKMSSLLATIDTGVIESPKNTGGPSLPYKHVQYFATGDAATLLALQRDVRLAMLARLDPNAEMRKNQFLSSLSGANTPLVSKIIYDVRRVLQTQPSNTRAQLLLADLDGMAQKFSYPAIDFYGEDANGIISPSMALKQSVIGYSPNDFGKLAHYADTLERSIQLLIAIENGTGKLPDPTNPAGKTPDAGDKQSYGRLRLQQQQELDRLNDELANSKAVYEAIRFFIS